jgi:myo-inositol-1(or 4)-monophosphatase
MAFTDAGLIELFDDIAISIRRALDGLDDWGLLADGAHGGQHGSDVVADHAALTLLERAGVGILSEESGLQRAEAEIVVIVDPVDGSTNASRGIPWYATSLAAVDQDGLRASLVVNQASGERFHAIRGGGAFRNNVAITPSECVSWRRAITGLSGLPPKWLGWSQFRALGACALDMSAVADGTLDTYVDCSIDAHGVWDYAGAMLICSEAGAVVGDAFGRDLLVMDHTARRTPIAANSQRVYDEAVAARMSMARPSETRS